MVYGRVQRAFWSRLVNGIIRMFPHTAVTIVIREDIYNIYIFCTVILTSEQYSKLQTK
jgi:hypothetical protein